MAREPWKNRLRGLVLRHEDINVAADKMIRSMSSDELRSALHDLMVVFARTEFTGLFQVRAQGSRVLDEIAVLPGVDRVFVPPAEVRELAWLVDGVRVSWSRATAGQHLARAGFCRRIAETHVASAVRHEAAAAVISEAGVSCLADLGVVAVAA
jgi:2-keto-3-deoxy-L-rhamnonate aldolase RhmA